MKKMLAVLAFSAVGAFAADWTGYIVDASCAGRQGAKSASEDHSGCAEKCIKGGAAAVLVNSEGKVFKIANQDKVTAHAGHKVTITGKMEGDTITVENVKM
jgi:hypothetical protein